MGLEEGCEEGVQEILEVRVMRGNRPSVMTPMAVTSPQNRKERKMVKVTFEYMDAYTNGEWSRQECIVRDVAECKKIYGLGIDCEYRIISVEEIN